MNEKEYTNVHALVGGTAAWKTAGYPMEKSDGTSVLPVTADPPKVGDPPERPAVP